VDQNIDIIDIAINLEKGPTNGLDELKIAIREATVKGTLIFTPAYTRGGSMNSVPYPARMRDVFCIYSTDGQFRISNYNPPPRLSEDNFAILGECVPVGSMNRPVSDTSVSTAIAAGVAGMLLDFVRQPDAYTIIKDGDPRRLRSKEGMTAIFNLMSKYHNDGGYKCLAPWDLFPPDHATQDRKTTRQEMFQTISKVLQR
jgi:hypothetical protein